MYLGFLISLWLSVFHYQSSKFLSVFRYQPSVHYLGIGHDSPFIHCLSFATAIPRKVFRCQPFIVSLLLAAPHSLSQYQSSIIYGPTLFVVCLGVIVKRCVCLCMLNRKNIFFFLLSIRYIGIFIIGIVAAVDMIKASHIKQKAHRLSFAFVDDPHIEFRFSCIYVLMHFIVTVSHCQCLVGIQCHCQGLPTLVVVAVMSVSLPVPVPVSLSPSLSF